VASRVAGGGKRRGRGGGAVGPRLRIGLRGRFAASCPPVTAWPTAPPPPPPRPRRFP